ncbi:hypothetical protein DIR46_02260 [Massilia oculi]|uniref:Uncharacterized protein n=2 Tax=Massilia oculi TaxID=945844 RepID=A0A2S2DE74_9BURK|nr:hypothetical protein DIR46_02260 [Massilia oculi]
MRRRYAYGGPNRRALANWIDHNMPELGAELDPMTKNQVRIRLNEITGCNVPAAGRVEDGCAVFLAALKKMKEAS